MNYLKINSLRTIKNLPKLLLIVLLAALLVISTAYATPGSLDTSFDDDGKVTTNLGRGLNDESAHGIAVQSDGKIVTAGYSDNGSDYDFALARYNSDGSLDNSFDGDTTMPGYPGNGSLDTTGFGSPNGYVTTDFNTYDDGGNAVAIQTGGEIVVTGYSDNGSSNAFALARYNSDGILDTSFDGDTTMPGYPGNGKVTTDFNTSYEGGNAVAIKPDGKIIVAGYSYDPIYSDFALARYNSDGSLDNSFDTDGKITTDFGSGYDYGEAIAIQTDGKIVVAGYSGNGSDDDFALARYNSDGSLDNSFDGDTTMPGFPGNGKVTTDFGSSDDRGYDVAIQTDGKIVVAGESYNGSDNDFALARYNSDGSLDTSFDGDTTMPGYPGNGKVTTDFNSYYDDGNSIAIQADGKIVVAGESYNGNDDDFALARYNSSDGSLDTSFDGDASMTGYPGNGKVTTDFDSDHDFIYAVAIQTDGKIVAAGYTDWEGDYDFALARYDSDGSLDTSFNTDGKITTDFNTNYTMATQLLSRRTVKSWWRG